MFRADLRKLSTTLFGETYTFPSTKEVLARANEPRSGDVQAGLAARSMREMAAAKLVLADVTTKALRECPSVPYELDEVTRVIEDDLSLPQADRAYRKICGWSAAELREWILDGATTGEQVSEISFGLTPEMGAAVAKLMSNMDLVIAGKKIRVAASEAEAFAFPEVRIRRPRARAALLKRRDSLYCREGQSRTGGRAMFRRSRDGAGSGTAHVPRPHM